MTYYHFKNCFGTLTQFYMPPEVIASSSNDNMTIRYTQKIAQQLTQSNKSINLEKRIVSYLMNIYFNSVLVSTTGS